MTFNNTTPVNFFDTQSNGRASSSPFVDIFQPRDPTPQDITTATAINNYAIQQKWLNTTTNALWELKNYTTSAGVLYANWIMLANHALVTESLRDQTGIDVFPDVTNEINLVGDGVYVITTGTPSTNTMTVSVTGAITTLYTENTGTATPMAGNLNVLGLNDIVTIGSGSTISISVSNPIRNWTPTIFGSTTAGVTTYSYQSGSYTRTGTMVYAQLNVVWSAATGTGNVVIGGFPYNFGGSQTVGGMCPVWVEDMTWPVGVSYFIGAGGDATKTMQIVGVVPNSTYLFLQMQHPGEINLSIIYETSDPF